MKVGLIFGTRPEAIKVAPVYHELKNNGIDVKAVVTGQHKEMLYQVLDLFEIIPDYDLQIMKQGQGLSELTGRLIIKLDEIIKKEKFDYILVQGDTTSVLAGALVGFYNQIPVGHIEAGLRTGNIYSPFPEEANRKLVGNIADIHFAPTDTNVNNLLKENYPKEKIIKCGNTVIDALYWVKKNKNSDIEKIKEKYNLLGKKYILITMHRRENWGQPMEETLTAVKDYLKEHEDLYLVFPMYLNPLVRNVVHEVLDDFERKILLEPLEYLEFIAVMDGAHYIMTDSGGVQEEAPSLGKPTLILRDTTERPEAIKAGTAKLVGTKYEDVTKYMKALEGELYHQMAKSNNPYGDGKTSEKIRKYLEEYKKENTIQKIPKIIHYCWFGRGEKNQKIKECMKSWEKYLSDYEIIEWNEDNFDINCNQYVKEAYENKKWAFVTDYVRLYALYHYGGIYMDTDVEVLKPLDIFLENKAFSGFEDEIHISTGIMGSIKGHNWVKFLLDDYKIRKFIKTNGEIDYTTNVAKITALSKEFFNFDSQKSYQILKDDVVIYPKDYFCPKSWENGEINLTENTYTIHHFNGSWFETAEEKRKRKLKRRLKRYIKIFITILVIIIIAYFMKS